MLVDWPVLHPPLLAAVARSGHGSQILLADANYPLATATHRHTERIYLNLRPGLISIDDALRAVTDLISVESIDLISPPTGTPPAHRTLVPHLPATPTYLQRDAFYAAARRHTVGVAIATGDTRHWTCLLLTLGAITAAEPDNVNGTRSPTEELS